MLFQPSNLSPSMLGTPGNGVVDLNHGLAVSWQVNGNSPLTAYQIDISTTGSPEIPVYSTGQQTVTDEGGTPTPFYGVDAAGQIQRFSAATITDFTETTSSGKIGSVTLNSVNYATFRTQMGKDGIFWFQYHAQTGSGYSAIGYYLYDDPTQYIATAANFRTNYGVDTSGYRDGDIVWIVYHPGNGTEYQYKITQWWSASDFIAQSSSAVFQARTTPALTIDALSDDPLPYRSYTFTASFSQPDGDTVSWVRWILTQSGNLSVPLYDSGVMYTPILSFTYDGLFRGVTYALRCTVGTSSGMEVSTGWFGVPVDYPAGEYVGILDAAKDCESSAVKVSFAGLRQIPGKASGGYSISDGLAVDPGETVVWETENNLPLLLETPWSLFFDSSVRSNGADGFSIITNVSNPAFPILTASYDSGSSTLSVNVNGTDVLSIPNVNHGDRFRMTISGNAISARVTRYRGGLYPSNTLYPSGSLYPRDNSTEETTAYTATLPDGWQDAISEIYLTDVFRTYLVQIFGGEAEAEDLLAFLGGLYTPTWTQTTQFLSTFALDLSGGNISDSVGVIQSLALYRNGPDGLHLVSNLPATATGALDYAARSQQGPYRYELFPIGDAGDGRVNNATAPLESGEVNPCFWNWSVLDCKQQPDGTFRIVREIAFSYNVSSGSVSNNNDPGVFDNLTRYPTVQRSPQNYQSGTLSSLIGSAFMGKYSDTLELRNAIYALSTTNDTLFLKNRKGDLLRIAVAGEISMTTQDNSREQAMTVSLPWVEIGSADGVAIWDIH